MIKASVRCPLFYISVSNFISNKYDKLKYSSFDFHLISFQERMTNEKDLNL